jgi:succinate dehydrogenase/fumarate reductase flavoprotein subunit
MITELFKKNGKIAGAIGFPMEEDKAVIIKAKAVVLCSGSGALKTPGFPCNNITHDGDAMSYRVGAEITGKEFCDFHWTHWENPADAYGNWERVLFETIRPRVYTLGGRGAPNAADMPLQAHNGNVPYIRAGRASPGTRSADLPIIWGSTAGMSSHKCEGVFPKGNKCSSSIPGLFAAGDALFTAGASYSGGGGSSSSGSAVQGARAGRYAAEYAKENKQQIISDSELAQSKERIFAPRTSEKGFSPIWITQVLQGIMVPYYVLNIKKQRRLEAALSNVEFLREQFAPNLLANDTHQLRLAHETRNMLLNSEMKLRAGLMRTESRGDHYREDYPDTDDKNWLAWIIITKDGDNMKLEKRPIPDEWKPGA